MHKVSNSLRHTDNSCCLTVLSMLFYGCIDAAVGADAFVMLMMELGIKPQSMFENDKFVGMDLSDLNACLRAISLWERLPNVVVVDR